MPMFPRETSSRSGSGYTAGSRLAANDTCSKLRRSLAPKAAQSVVIRPLLVDTIQRLPQRTIESIRPAPGTVSPTATFQTPVGPCSTALRPVTARAVQPSIVFGLVSGIGVELVEVLFSRVCGTRAGFVVVVF